MSDNDMNRFILDKLEKVDDKLEEVRVKYAQIEEAFRSHEDLDEKIHKSVEKMSEDMSAQMTVMCKSLDQYNDLLQEHMRRTEIAESNITILKDRVEPMWKQHEKQEIIEAYADKKWKTRMKWIAGIGTAAGTILTIMKLLNIF